MIVNKDRRRRTFWRAYTDLLERGKKALIALTLLTPLALWALSSATNVHFETFFWPLFVVGNLAMMGFTLGLFSMLSCIWPQAFAVRKPPDPTQKPPDRV